MVLDIARLTVTPKWDVRELWEERLEFSYFLTLSIKTIYKIKLMIYSAW